MYMIVPGFQVVQTGTMPIPPALIGGSPILGLALGYDEQERTMLTLLLNEHNCLFVVKLTYPNTSPATVIDKYCFPNDAESRWQAMVPSCTEETDRIATVALISIRSVAIVVPPSARPVAVAPVPATVTHTHTTREQRESHTHTHTTHIHTHTHVR